MTHYNIPGVPTSNAASSLYPQPGLNHVGEYVASGVPFVTASSIDTTAIAIELPYVSSRLYFNVPSGSLRVGFTENGVNGSNYYLVTANSQHSFDIRCATVFVRAEAGTVDMSMMAALTQIDRDRMPRLTGSYADPQTGKNMFNTGSIENVVGYNGLG